MIDTREDRFGSVAVLVVTPPSHQERIDVVDDVLQIEQDPSTGREALDSPAEALDPILWNFQSRPVAAMVMPLKPDAMNRAYPVVTHTHYM